MESFLGFAEEGRGHLPYLEENILIAKLPKLIAPDSAASPGGS